MSSYNGKRFTFCGIREGVQKKRIFLGEIFPKCVYPPTQGFLRDLGKRKVKFGSKKAIFAVIWGGFEGVGPCLGISHPTHPHLGKISQKKRSFLDASPNADNSLNHRIYLGSRVSGKRFSRGIYVLEISRVC